MHANGIPSHSDEEMFTGGLMRPPHESLMVALGLTPQKNLSRGAKSFLGLLVVLHIEQVMRDKWLAWEVKRVLKKKYPKMQPDENVTGTNPHPNTQWGQTRDAIYQVITHPDVE
jgi:hypothetical protein